MTGRCHHHIWLFRFEAGIPGKLGIPCVIREWPSVPDLSASILWMLEKHILPHLAVFYKSEVDLINLDSYSSEN